MVASNERLTYSIAEGAAILGISRNLCYDLVRQRKIPAVRLGRKRLVIPRHSLLKLLNGAANQDEKAD